MSPDPLAVLTESQQAAATHRGGPLVVLGGAGTGKTSALLARFAHLTSPEGDVAPEQVLMLTGGEAAADELRARVEDVLGDRGFAELAVHTPSGFAARLLREEAMEAGIDPTIGMATSADRLALLLARIDELPLKVHDLAGRPAATLARLLARIDRSKEQLVSADAFRAWADGLADDDARTVREREFAALYGAHDALLAQLDLLDSGDLVLRAHALLAGRPHVLARAAARYRHVLADDHQDATPAAHALIALLGSANGTLTLAGDDDQAVRRTGPTRPPGMDALRGDEPKATVIRLERSFRCRARIITAAQAVVAQAPERLPKRLEGEGGGNVRFWRCANERAQAQGVAAEIERLIREGVPPEGIGVLVRSVRNEGQAVAVALEERAVPYRIVGAAAFFQRTEVRDVLAWLRLLVEPGDAAAVVRVLARPPVELRAVDLARCVQIARRRKLDMVSALGAAMESPQLPPEARERILAFLKLHRQTAAALDTMRPDLFVHRLIDRLGLRRQQLFAAQADVVERLLALARLGELAAAHTARTPTATARDFARYLTAVADAGLRDEEELDESAAAPRGAVAVLAMHGARGVELQHAFVLGLQSSRMPGARQELVEPVPAELLDGSRAIEDDRAHHVAHMRRLLHVAMTRAQSGLVLAYAAASDRGARQPPSPFAEEARAALGAGWEDREEILFGPDEALHATYATLRDELLSSVSRVGSRLGELRLDTDLDVTHGVTRYLELVKLAAILERPAGQSVRDAIVDVNSKILQPVSAHQREVFTSSGLDELLLNAEADARARAAVIADRAEPSLEPFLPKRGDGLMLSASDIETYRSCPLKYKFARVFRIPSESTMNQRFGILFHQVLERFHGTAPAEAYGAAVAMAEPGSVGQLLGLLDAGWRRGGFGDTEEERQFRAKAVAALHSYHARFTAEQAEPMWLEKGFQFKLGPHVLRGRVDRVDRLADGSYELIDYKTGRPRTVAQLREDVQLSLYAVGAREAWQLESSRQAYHYVLDDQKVRVPAEDLDRDWITDTVMHVADGILSQGFEPTPSFSACSMCDYRIACPAAER
ncbi:DNA helicase [Paraconexibacter sp. AEG42_29]|uniref:DNA 3'-5' helicase n=1 Tax=Paraconexibacter sp. AEG42_29 TaxID=2997339 RepID=A0AAU7B2Y6_9ACTN